MHYILTGMMDKKQMQILQFHQEANHEKLEKGGSNEMKNCSYEDKNCKSAAICKMKYKYNTSNIS